MDKLPPVRLDLDFLDTSGYVVLPIESPALPIDAGAAKAPSPAPAKAPDHARRSTSARPTRAS